MVSNMHIKITYDFYVHISWEIYKKLKTVDFFNMCYFIFEIEIINIAFAKKKSFSFKSWRAQFVVDYLQFLCINLKVSNNINFFWELFFYDYLEFGMLAMPGKF